MNLQPNAKITEYWKSPTGEVWGKMSGAWKKVEMIAVTIDSEAVTVYEPPVVSDDTIPVVPPVNPDPPTDNNDDDDDEDD